MTQTGVTHKTDAATDGCVLFAPAAGDRAYLVDYNGEVVPTWSTGKGFTNWCCLLPNGNLFMNERCEAPQGVALTGSGLMREYDWYDNLVWEHLV